MDHSQYLQRCLELAARGRGRTGVNPLVGALLVRDGEVMAEGWHAGWGQPHAERMLLENNEQINCSECTLYVNLEPCSHQGKTQPCTDIILESGVKTVVFGMLDPNPAVAGKGLEALKAGGLEVVGPVEPVRCRRFNRGFCSLHEQGRPWITLKRAQTREGRIAHDDGAPLKITSPEQDEWSHTWLRATHDAIMVGVETVIRDDPLLTVRQPTTNNQQPVRIILDPNLRVPLDARVVTPGTLVVTAADDAQKQQQLEEKGVKIAQIPLSGATFDLAALWSALTTPVDDFHGVSSILVEGGQRTWESFKQAGCIDEEVMLVGA